MIVFQLSAFNESLSNWQLYQNGQLANSVSGTYYPQAAIRQNANLGLSGWDDPQFAGLLDTFNVYDVALSETQVAQLFQNATGGYTYCYSNLLSTIPPDATFFEADFTTDPATVSDPTYVWLQVDPTDNVANQLYHQGIIVLSGTNPVDQYVDLGLSSGPASVTSQPIQPFGGLGTGAIADSSLGWSFEIVFKSFAQSVWGKAFDFSNNAGDSGTIGGSWDVLFGWQADEPYYAVNLYYNVSEQDESYEVTPDPFPLDTWTSFVWVIQYDAQDTYYDQPTLPFAIHSTYVNGQLYTNNYNEHYIDYVIRQHGFLGRSSYNDSAWLGAIDTFRVYSVALNAQQVATLYEASNGGATGSSSSSTGSALPFPSSSSSAPPTGPSAIYIYLYTATLTGEVYSTIDGVVFNVNLTLTVVFDGYTYLVTAATGTITRSDESDIVSIVAVAAIEAFFNDNLLFPYSAALEDDAGIAVVNGSGTLYSLYYSSELGYGLELSFLENAYNQTAPVLTLLCTATSATQTVCASSVLGDPQFVGLRGQSFQVHGIDGEVYALISEPAMQLNARFRFLTGPRPCPVMPSTGERCGACWSHDGSYLSEVGVLVKATGERVRVMAGNATQGFASVAVDDRQLAVNESTSTGTVALISTHELILTAGSFHIEMESVDGFVNMRRVELTVPFSQLRSHGLLGQTWSSKRHQSTLKVIEGEVDDYVLLEGDVLGSEFVYSQYGVQNE